MKSLMLFVVAVLFAFNANATINVTSIAINGFEQNQKQPIIGHQEVPLNLKVTMISNSTAGDSTNIKVTIGDSVQMLDSTQTSMFLVSTTSTVRTIPVSLAKLVDGKNYNMYIDVYLPVRSYSETYTIRMYGTPPVSGVEDNVITMQPQSQAPNVFYNNLPTFGAIYNLQGQRIFNADKPGYYIINEGNIIRKVLLVK